MKLPDEHDGAMLGVHSRELPLQDGVMIEEVKVP